MYVVGHFVVTERTNLFSDEELYGSGACALMLPDYVRCHDWGYLHCFQGDALPETVDGALIRAHLLGDWYVHYGEGMERKKRGWAYRNMAVYSRRYHEFFERAARMGIREDAAPADSPQGFSHTMVEDTIDTYLATQGTFDSRFPRVRSRLGQLGRSEGDGSHDWIRRTLDQNRIEHNSPDLAGDVESFRERVDWSTGAEELAYWAGVKKFGLTFCSDSVAFLRSFLADGLSEIPGTQVASLIEECAAFVAEWLSRLHRKEIRSWT